jgi:two-component system, chemotaxis family, chemotaxis protein CheY
MRILVVEDDLTSRLLLMKMLEPLFGSCDFAVNGKEAVEAFRQAQESGQRYGLVCLDIMMPEMDGQEALKAMRAEESARFLPPSRAAKIVMTTALRDLDHVTNAHRELCDGYLVKPIQREKLVAQLKELDLLPLREEHLVT